MTSHGTARPPISAARDSIRSVRRAAQTTSKPSPASDRAVAAPIPLLAPVTTAMRGLMAAILHEGNGPIGGHVASRGVPVAD